ncbi:MAG: hypothetical protein ACK41Q_07085, partial [Candidatus Brocadia sp.]
MPETTAGLSNQNDLFGNLFIGIRSPTNNSISHATDIDAVQSEIGVKERDFVITVHVNTTMETGKYVITIKISADGLEN